MWTRPSRRPTARIGGTPASAPPYTARQPTSFVGPAGVAAAPAALPGLEPAPPDDAGAGGGGSAEGGGGKKTRRHAPEDSEKARTTPSLWPARRTVRVTRHTAVVCTGPSWWWPAPPPRGLDPAAAARGREGRTGVAAPDEGAAAAKPAGTWDSEAVRIVLSSLQGGRGAGCCERGEVGGTSGGGIASHCQTHLSVAAS
jgi:hypothetical protein